MRNYLLIGLALLAVGCSTQHTVGAGNPSLGVVSITGPSDNTVPVSGRSISAADAAKLMGLPFVGPTSPVLVMPSNANGVVTATFSSNNQSSVNVELGLRVGAYNFDFTTTDVSGSLGVGQTIMIKYGGRHFGENGSCTDWTATDVVFTQGNPTGYDTLAGSYAATCHNSQNAKDGDRGTFLLKRPGTLVTHDPPPPPVVCVPPQVLQGGVCVTPPPPPPPPPPTCSGIILNGIEEKVQGNWTPLGGILTHDAHPQLRLSITLTPPGCIPPTVTASSDKDWLTIDNNQNAPGYVLFSVVGNSGNAATTTTRYATITVNGLSIIISQDPAIEHGHGNSTSAPNSCVLPLVPTLGAGNDVYCALPVPQTAP
jgi:hypothetical protein